MREAIKPYAVCLVMCAALILALVSCIPHLPGSRGLTNSQQSLNKTAPTKTPLELAVLTQTTPTAIEDTTGLAPSFEEIQAEAYRITSGNTELTDEQRQELKEYSKSLEGKKINGSQGWVSTVEPMRDIYQSLTNPVDPYPFEVWIRMYSSVHEPAAPPFSQVVLTDVPLEQVEKLTAWTTPVLDLSVPLQEVVFSGTMYDAQVPNKIYVKHAYIQLAELP